MWRLVAAVVAPLLFAACAGTDGEATTTTALSDTTVAPGTTGAPGTTAAPATTVPTPPPDPDVTITISGFSYGPQRTVSVGDVIRVINEDPVPHTWTSTDRHFDSGTLTGDRAFFHSFDEPGEYEFFCTVHPADMRGSIVVEE